VAAAEPSGTDAGLEAKQLATEGARKTTTEQSCKTPGAMPAEQTSTRKRQQAAHRRNAGLLIRWGAQEISHPDFEKCLETLCLNREKIIKDNKICPFCLLHKTGEIRYSKVNQTKICRKPKERPHSLGSRYSGESFEAQVRRA
jgi:hypothetical protein